MSINLKFEGFEDLLKDIEAAGRSMESAANSCIRESAQTMNNALKTEMQSSGVDSSLINALPQPEIFKDGNAFVAKVGYKKGSYNPNDLSDGYKVLFYNYGTPHRTKHGKIAEHGFVERAKKSAQPKIKKQQKATLQKILSRL